MPKAGDVVAAKYRIEQLIGLGGMGAVFSAIHQYTGKRVALKWMLPELAQEGDAVHRFLREAQAAGRISHPNVVDVYDVGQHAGSYFLVMEFLQGEPLTSALARRDLTPSEVLSLLLPAMRGVAAAHRQGVIHRDLKPDNIFLAYEEDGVRREAKVLDFGISKLSVDDQPNLHLTRTGAVVGTPYYMSPEQIRGSQGLDRRADIYSMGVILYESLAGQVPFHAETYGALVLEIATGTARPLTELVPNLPAELSRIVLRAMARDVEARYASMEDLVAALEPFAGASRSGTSWQKSGTGVPVALDETRAEPLPDQYPPPSSVATKPQLASTPFASEAAESLRRNDSRMVFGVAAFCTAAAAVVGVIWYLTRTATPEVPVAAPGVPAGPLGPGAVEEHVRAATAQPIEVLPRGLDPANPAPGQPPALAAPAQDLAAPAKPVGAAASPTLSPRGTREAGPGPEYPQEHGTGNRHREARETKTRNAGPRGRAASSGQAPMSPSELERPVVAPREQSAEKVEKPDDKAEKGTPSSIHRARSGALNVNEF